MRPNDNYLDNFLKQELVFKIEYVNTASYGYIAQGTAATQDGKDVIQWRAPLNKDFDLYDGTLTTMKIHELSKTEQQFLKTAITVVKKNRLRVLMGEYENDV